MKQLCFLFFLFLSYSVQGIVFSDIMYNPHDGNEWVDLYFNETRNIINNELRDNFSTDQVTCCGETPCDFIIPNNKFDIFYHFVNLIYI